MRHDEFVSEIEIAFARDDHERVSALIDWAHAHLSAEEQEALARLFDGQPVEAGNGRSSGATAILAVALAMRERGVCSFGQFLRLSLTEEERLLALRAIAHLPGLMSRRPERAARRGYDWPALRARST